MTIVNSNQNSLQLLQMSESLEPPSGCVSHMRVNLLFWKNLLGSVMRVMKLKQLSSKTKPLAIVLSDTKTHWGLILIRWY